MTRTTHRPLPALVLLLLLAACSSTPGRPSGVPSEMTAAQVPAQVELAGSELEAQENLRALWRMRIATDTRGLDSATRQSVGRTLAEAAMARLGDLRGKPRSAAELKELSRLELPREISVTLGVEAARSYLAKEERMKAYRMLKEVDERYPLHGQRQVAGDVMAEAGLSLARDPRRYMLFFHYRDKAPEVLEYFTTHFPQHPRGPEAYEALSQAYQRDRLWDLAIARDQDVVLYYPGTDWAVQSQARIPHLRLLSSGSPEYDRRTLALARKELEGWLADHAGHPLEREVRLDLTDTLRRLADNDLIVARFYRRVGNPTGFELAARRGLDEARDGGDPGQIAEAEALLAEAAQALAAERGDVEPGSAPDAEGPPSVEAPVNDGPNGAPATGSVP